MQVLKMVAVSSLIIFHFQGNQDACGHDVVHFDVVSVLSGLKSPSTSNRASNDVQIVRKICFC